MRSGGGSACQQGRLSPAPPSAWASVLCGVLPRGPLGQTLPQGEGQRLVGGQLGLPGSVLSRWGLGQSRACLCLAFCLQTLAALGPPLSPSPTPAPFWVRGLPPGSRALSSRPVAVGKRGHLRTRLWTAPWGGQEAAWVLTMGVSALARLHSEGPPLLVNLGPSQVWLLVRGQRLLPRAPPQALVHPLAVGSLGGSSVKGAQLLSPVRGGQSAPSVLPGLPGPEHWVPAHPMRWWEWPQVGGALRGQARPLPTPTLCR